MDDECAGLEAGDGEQSVVRIDAQVHRRAFRANRDHCAQLVAWNDAVQSDLGAVAVRRGARARMRVCDRRVRSESLNIGREERADTFYERNFLEGVNKS